MASTVDGAVLGSHDSLHGGRVLDVASEAWHFGDDNHDLCGHYVEYLYRSLMHEFG